MSLPLWMCMLSWGHQETRNHPMARYAAHVLQLEPPKARLNGANPKSKNEMPSPNVSASKTARKRKKGNCPAVGSGPPGAGGQSTWPRAIAGTAKRAVTRATLTQGFNMYSFRWLSRASVLEVSGLRALGTSPIWARFVCQVAISASELRRTPDGRTSENSVLAKFAFWGFCEVRIHDLA